MYIANITGEIWSYWSPDIRTCHQENTIETADVLLGSLNKQTWVNLNTIYPWQLSSSVLMEFTWSKYICLNCTRVFGQNAKCVYLNSWMYVSKLQNTNMGSDKVLQLTTRLLSTDGGDIIKMYSFKLVYLCKLLNVQNVQTWVQIKSCNWQLASSVLMEVTWSKCICAYCKIYLSELLEIYFLIAKYKYGSR